VSEAAGNGGAPAAEAVSPADAEPRADAASGGGAALRADAAPRASAEVRARFALHAGSGRDAADGAAELIHRLQEMTSLPRCACDLDVSVEWPSHSR
jgi:hypothetical protein